LIFQIIKITGRSLTPILENGDYIIICKHSFILKKLKVGDIIVFNQPTYGLMVKQISKIIEHGKEFFVTGLHEQSIDSGTLGPININSIIGKKVLRIRK
jgi:signal peptidase I